ncbi:fungal-specific transcription factor domain-domain-containing protein [Syncephalastrum racemosum]|uniref:Fungal-specific transcription factor domain-domain-containing protein n=1 Tax=Syncephalastrum racemosum TaxID=13706 RepID=A0A1X2GZ69_SYNRA|nr:fungal-specific transcription factor domain-domain-containing protein [Syncephalastrum racemosum]
MDHLFHSYPSSPLLNGSPSATTTATVTGATPPVPLKRTRAKRSCDFCRKRKSRCDADASIPCSNCRAWGYTCEFQAVRKKRGPPSVYVDNLEKRCKKMEKLLMYITKLSIKDLEQTDFQYHAKLNANKSTTTTTTTTTSTTPASTAAAAAAVAAQREASPFDSSDSSSDDDDDEYDDDDFDPTATSHDGLDVRDYDGLRYSGQSAGLPLVDESMFQSKSYLPWPGRDDVVLKMMAQDEVMIVKTSSGKKGDTRHLDVGLSMRTALLERPLSPPARRSNLPLKASQALSDEMVDLYFTHLHALLPILNKTRFVTQYRQRKAPRVLVYAVLALALRAANTRAWPIKHTVDNLDALANHYFAKVMKSLRDATVRSRLCHVQAALLMTLYLDMDEGDVEAVQWFTLGKAIRMAQDLGLHHSCAHWKLPRSEVETRHRVFYACYVLDRWTGARAGKPLTILDRDFNTPMPSAVEITDEDKEAEGQHETKKEKPYATFLLMIKLSEILGRLLKAMYAPNSKNSNHSAGLDDPTIRTVFEQRLKNWMTSFEEHALMPSHKGHLLVLYNTVLLLLHRPFIRLSPQQYPGLASIIEDARTQCTGAATAILDTVRTEDMSSLLVWPTCFVYSLYQATLIMLSNVLQQRTDAPLPALQNAIALLQSYKDVCSAPRAIEIIQMLMIVSQIPLSHSDGPRRPLLQHQQQQHHLYPYQHLHPLAEASSQTMPAVPTVHKDMQYPKSNHIFERMINCSVVGGITPDIRPDVESAMARQPTDYFLPPPDIPLGLDTPLCPEYVDGFDAPRTQYDVHPLPPSFAMASTSSASPSMSSHDFVFSHGISPSPQPLQPPTHAVQPLHPPTSASQTYLSNHWQWNMWH